MVWWATDNGLKFYVSLINNNFSICSGIKYLWTFWAGMHIFRVGWLAGDCLELTSMGKSGIDSTKHQWSWVIWLEVFQVWQPGQCIQISIPKDPFWIVKKYALSSYGFFHDPHWFFSPGHFLFLDSPYQLTEHSKNTEVYFFVVVVVCLFMGRRPYTEHLIISSFFLN